MTEITASHRDAIAKVAKARRELHLAERELRLHTDPRTCQHNRWELSDGDTIECVVCGVYCSGEALAAMGFRMKSSGAEQQIAELRKLVAR